MSNDNSTLLGAQAQIDLDAIRHNLKCVKSYSPNSKVMAIIKANAYGHGLEKVAFALSEADAFGVSSLAEAMQLQVVVDKPIIILMGFNTLDELELIAKLHFQPVIHNQHQLQLLKKIKLSCPLSLWLKIDSGMHRLGISVHEPEGFMAAIKQLQQNPDIQKPLGLMTHLACADELENDATVKQLLHYESSTAGIEHIASIANSAAIIAWKNSHRDWVRPGIMLYGVSPFPHKTGADFGLKPVMTLLSHIIAINHYKKGDVIGYGANWTCPRHTTIAVVAIGYGDGYPRHAQSGTPVMIGQQQATLVGRVSMDMICVDITHCTNIHINDIVTLWGGALGVEKVAHHANTIAYQLVCGLTGRVRYSYLNE